jgi:hypothetical protein
MRRFSVVLIAVALSACVHSGGTKITDEQLASVTDGGTTISEIRARFGQPLTEITDSDGLHMLGYGFNRVETNGKAFIPIAGPFLMGGTSEYQVVNFSFDQAGVLKKHTVLRSTQQFGHP